MCLSPSSLSSPAVLSAIVSLVNQLGSWDQSCAITSPFFSFLAAALRQHALRGVSQIGQDAASASSCASVHSNHLMWGKIAMHSVLSPRDGPSAMLLFDGTLAIQLRQSVSLSSVQKDCTSHALSKHGDDPLIKANLARSLSTKWITSLPLILSFHSLLAQIAR